VYFFDKSYELPAENLAADEELLNLAEAGEIGPVLRFWESPRTFVTLGYTNKAAREANLEECEKQNVPILRRVSGGGTVLQGRGSWNYALIHPIPNGETLNVEATNCMVMKRNRDLMSKVTGEKVQINGHTDLEIGGRKISGNAQRRKAKYFLFHGTMLIDFDLDLVQTLLQPPPKQPDYRQNRSHLEFVRNLGVSREAIKQAFCEAWGAKQELEIDLELTGLIEERYGRDDWNFRF
jgi:lipoate-protein ligase A